MSRESIQAVYVVEKIKEDIIYRRITECEQLTENNLASTIGVSRTPVREAIKALEKEGVLRRENGRLTVNYMDHFQSIELELIRSKLEGIAAKFAAKRINDNGKQRILSIMKESENYKGSNLFELSKLNDQFHLSIAEESGLSILADMLRNIQTKLKLSQSVKFISKERRVNSVKEHRKLANLIISGEALKAEKFAEHHAKVTYELMLQAISQTDKEKWIGPVTC
jgi:DNA-binding GntR family transcriptional regulator